MKINIQGRIVEVDDSFAQLSAEEQNRTVDEIAKSLNINAGKAQQPEPKTPFFERVKQVVTEPTRAIEPAKTVATSPTTGNLSSPALTALNLIQRGLGLPGAQDLLRGAAETAATVGTGLGSQVLGAMGGVAEAMRGGAPKLGTPESNRLAIERAKQIQQGATYQPRTEMGQEMLGGLASGLEESRIPPYLAGIPPNVAASALRQAQPGMQQAARAAAQPIVSAAQAPRNVLRGFVNPEQGLKQIEPTMVKPQAVQQFLDEKLNARQVLNPENLVQTDEVLKSDLDKLARIISNDQVPYTGKLSEAFGARMRAAYERPYGVEVDIASLLGTGLITGIPLPFNAISRATKTLSDLYLQRKLGYNPRFASEFERRAAQEAEQQAMTQRSPGPVMPSTGISGIRLPEIYNIQTGPYSVPKGTGADAFSSGYAQQVSGITTTPPPGPSPIRITQPLPTAQTTPSLAEKASTMAITNVEPLKLKRIAEPTANTQAVTQELERRVSENPQLQGFNKPYVIPQKIKEPVNNFLNGLNKHAVAYGPPGTGKTSLAGEWLNRNSAGEIHILDRHTFDKKQATDLINRANISGKPTLFVIDEADQFSKSQVEDVLNLMDQTRVNGRLLVTSNDLSQVSDKLKTAEFSKIPVDTKLNLDEKQAYALNVASEFNVDKSPAEILKIASDPNFTNFRDIKRAVSEGYTKKEEPRFLIGDMPSDVIRDLNPRVIKYLDDFVNNETSKNLVIFDHTAFKSDPALATKLDKWEMPSTTEALQGLPNSLASSPTSSPVFRLVVRDEKDAASLTKLKSLIERSNESAFPTKIVVDHLYEKIDPAIRSRADIITGNDLQANKPNQPAPGPVEPFRVEVSGTAKTMSPAEKQLAAQAKADANKPVTNAERMAELMEEAEFLRAEKAKKEAAKASEVSGPVVPSTMAETTTPIIAPKTKTGMAALELAPESQPVIKKPPKITPQTSPLPTPRAPRNDLYSFPVKQYVQTYSRGGTRKLYDTVLNDIAEKTGITIDPKSIEDISKMTPKEAQSAVANAYRKAVKEHLANPRNTVTVSVIDPKTKTLTKKQMPDIFE